MRKSFGFVCVFVLAASLAAQTGREFQIGEVRLCGLRLCEPCSHLASMTSDIFSKALVHRGGLRAQIVSGGVIRAGDPIEVHR